MATMAVLLVALLQDHPVKVVKDVPYYDGPDADPKKHRLDLYLPVTDRPFPMLLWIHGGGWMIGDRSMYGGVGERFAERGLGCAVTSYRLSPGVKHPEHVKDCARAFAWLADNAKKRGGDPDRLFVFGQSAGGHLTALLTLDHKYLEELQVSQDAIKGAIPMSGVYEIPALQDPKQPLLTMFPKSFGSDREVCRDASPLSHLKGSTTPMLVITESDDLPVRLQMEMFKRATEHEGLKNIQFADAPNRNHLSIVLKLMGKEDDPVRDRIVDFVHTRCRELDGK